MKFWFKYLTFLLGIFLLLIAMPNRAKAAASLFVPFKKTDYLQVLNSTGLRLKQDFKVADWSEWDRNSLLQTAVLLNTPLPENWTKPAEGMVASCQWDVYQLQEKKEWANPVWQEWALKNKQESACLILGAKFLWMHQKYELLRAVVTHLKHDEKSAPNIPFYLAFLDGLAALKVGEAEDWRNWVIQLSSQDRNPQNQFVIGVDLFLQQSWASSADFWQTFIANFLEERKKYAGKNLVITEEFRWAHYFLFVSKYFRSPDDASLLSDREKIKKLFGDGYVTVWLQALEKHKPLDFLSYDEMGVSPLVASRFLGLPLVEKVGEPNATSPKIPINVFKEMLPIHLFY